MYVLKDSLKKLISKKDLLLMVIIKFYNFVVSLVHSKNYNDNSVLQNFFTYGVFKNNEMLIG